MSDYDDNMELETIRCEQGGRVARNHAAADLAAILGGRTWDGVWSHCEMMYTQIVTGLGVRVRRRKLGRKAYNRVCDQWMPNPEILRREQDW